MRNMRAITILICITALGLVAGLGANTAEAFAAPPSQEQEAPPNQDQAVPPNQEQETPPSQEQEAPPSELFSADQLDNLLAPIALYPDPLLAQVLLASTFVGQIDEASRWLRANNDPNEIDNAPWDVSVKAVAHYPSVLYMMSDKIDWTTSLGQAYVNQSTDVMTSIQRLRALAQSAGNLVTNREQQIIDQGPYIQIVPMQPEYIYVPMYDPYAVYYRGGYGFGVGFGGNLISFGTGFAIGAWLNYDFDWGGHRVFYHGWGGGEGGWIGRSRPNIRINSIYVNTNYANIRVNRQVVNNNVNYNNLNRYNSVHRQVNYTNVTQQNRGNGRNFGNPGNPRSQGYPVNQPNRGNVRAPVGQGYPVYQGNQGIAVPNQIIQRNMDTTDPRINIYRGRQRIQQPQAQQPSRPPSPVYGGDRSAFDPRAASERGQASRMSAGQSRGAAPSQSNARGQSRPAKNPPPARSSDRSEERDRR
jgi:Protein of unknown function (DUF3300)